MKILCTFPGKFGDVLWALPTIRALARRTGTPVDLLIATPFASILPLLSAQPYIARCWADPQWEVQDTAPMTPRIPPGREDVISPYEHTFDLGYRGWPQRPLPFETLDCLNEQQRSGYQGVIGQEDLDLGTPWITTRGGPDFVPFNPRATSRIAVGFTDEHFELKYGLTELIDEVDYRWEVTPVGRSPRWDTEGGGHGGMNWEETLAALQAADVFLGCNSALHVLAVACGTPVVMMEPNPHRHHDIFYPLGKTGPQVTLICGNDGLPTFDARHCADAITLRLKESHT